MSPQPGEVLLHYRLIDKLGEGGMGVVWRAVDTTLDREVAIKILPEEFSGNRDRLDRFEREAKLLASLNHPGLASVYGVHESNGTRFIAMELIPGEDLSDRLNRRPLPISESRSFARQIAEALEAAHRRGVIHRDLKPANIKVSPDGCLKILDFGLAKTVDAHQDFGAGLSSSPTATAAGTVAGTILGTTAYMSPEQARGLPVDQRSDIWSFGCIVWECLTGQALFAGNTASDSIGAILHQEPDWSVLPSDTPASVRRLLGRCLAKDAVHRLHHIADARIELDDEEQPEPRADKPRQRDRILIAVLSVAVVASLIIVFLAWLRPEPDSSGGGFDNPLAGSRFTRITDFTGSNFDGAISPDGRFVAFLSDLDGPFDVFVGQVGAGGFQKATRENGVTEWIDVRATVRSLGFNGDGSKLWFGGGMGRRLLLVSLLGGSAHNFLGDEVVNVAWSPDGERIVYQEQLPGDPISIADRNGANAEVILDSPEGNHQHYPIFSTDGRWIYLIRGRPATMETALWRVGVDGRGLEQLTHGKIDLRYPTPLDERTVLFTARDEDGAGPWLWALDVETGATIRASVGLEQYSSVAASADGRRLVATVQLPRSQLWQVPILDHPATESEADPFADLGDTRALAPRFGGSSLFFLSSSGSGNGLWRLQSGEILEIWRGSEGALLEAPAVAPGGDDVVILLRRAGGGRLHRLSADGAQLEALSETVDARGSASWSPDGRWVVTGGSVGGVVGLFKIPIDGGSVERIVDGEALNPVWSPDGSLIVYTGPQVGPFSPLMAVRPDGEPVELPEISVTHSGENARFLPDGSGLIYLTGLRPPQDFWLLDLQTMDVRRLTALENTQTMRTFDVTPDGRRIVFDRRAEDSAIVLIERVD